MDFNPFTKHIDHAISVIDQCVFNQNKPDKMVGLLKDLETAVDLSFPNPKSKPYVTKKSSDEEWASFTRWHKSVEKLLVRSKPFTDMLNDYHFKQQFLLFEEEWDKIQAEYFPPREVDKVPDDRDLADATLVVKHNSESGDSDGFKTVTYTKKQKGKGKAKPSQRSQTAVKLDIEPAHDDVGSDVFIDRVSLKGDFYFKSRAVMWYLAYQPANYGWQSADGTLVKAAGRTGAKCRADGLKAIETKPPVYFNVERAPKELLLTLRASHLMSSSHLKSMYLLAGSRTEEALPEEECELSASEAESAYSLDEMENAQVSFWAAQAEEILKAANFNGKLALVNEMYNRLAEMPSWTKRGEAARMFTRFLKSDIEKHTSPNKSVTTMRNALFASWRQGESREAYIKRIKKTLAVIWGGDTNKLIEEFIAMNPQQSKPKSLSSIEMLKKRLNEAKPKAKSALKTVVESGKTYAAALKQAVVSDVKEARSDIPKVGWKTWFQSWYKSKITITKTNLKTIRKKMAKQGLFNRLKNSFTAGLNWGWNKSAEITPSGVKGVKIVARMPRISYLWCKVKFTNFVRWCGRNMWELNEKLAKMPSGEVLFDADTIFSDLKITDDGFEEIDLQAVEPVATSSSD